MTSRSEKARQYFLDGYNCSQAVLLAFCDDGDLDKETLLKAVSPFGGGMGRLREVCGAVSGMFMAAGLIYGYADPKAKTEKAALYKKIQDLAATSKAQNGSIICRELLGLSEKTSSPIPEERTSEYYKKRPCAELVARAAGILEEMIEQEKTAEK